MYSSIRDSNGTYTGSVRGRVVVASTRDELKERMYELEADLAKREMQAHRKEQQRLELCRRMRLDRRSTYSTVSRLLGVNG